MLRASLCVLALALPGCVVPPTSAMRLAESAHDLNTAARFGRMDIALEHVKDTAQDDFRRRHATWGRSVRIVDYEFGGMEVRKDGDADVTVTVNWQRLDESIMRTTDVRQRWTEKRGTWRLTKESENSGDRGLLAELAKADAPNAESSAAPAAPPPRPARSRYQTRVIYEQ